VGTIGRSRDEKALIAADTTNRAEMKDTEEPIPERAVGVVERFGVTVRADLSVRKHGDLSAVMRPKFRSGVNYFERIAPFVSGLSPKWEMKILHCERNGRDYGI
jgi:hypothetical protein